MSRPLNDSASKPKTVVKRDKQQIRQIHRRQFQQAKLQQERQEAKLQIIKLKQTGLVTAYQQFLRDICKNGLPQPANIYELAAQFVLKFQKKYKAKKQKKQELQRQNNDLLNHSKNYETIGPLTERKRSTYD